MYSDDQFRLHNISQRNFRFMYEIDVIAVRMYIGTWHFSPFKENIRYIKR